MRRKASRADMRSKMRRSADVRRCKVRSPAADMRHAADVRGAAAAEMRGAAANMRRATAAEMGRAAATAAMGRSAAAAMRGRKTRPAGQGCAEKNYANSGRELPRVHDTNPVIDI
jgi:hypothetical protein